MSIVLAVAALASCTPSSVPVHGARPAGDDGGSDAVSDGGSVEAAADAASGSVGAPPDCEPLSMSALQRAFDAVDVQSCKRPNGPTGAGRVEIVYVPKTGRVRSAVLQQGPFSGTPEGTCVLAAFRATTVPPFCPAESSKVAKPFVIH